MVTLKDFERQKMEYQLDDFINQVITDKNLSGLTDEVREQLVEDLRQRLMDQIDRAIIDALPEDKAIEFSNKLDDENFGDEQVQQFMNDSGVDMQGVTLATMLRFRELYLGAGA